MLQEENQCISEAHAGHCIRSASKQFTCMTFASDEILVCRTRMSALALHRLNIWVRWRIQQHQKGQDKLFQGVHTQSLYSNISQEAAVGP